MVDDGRTTDDGRTPDHGHPISSPCEPNGSGELKMHLTILLFHPCVPCIKLIKKQANIMVQQCQKRYWGTYFNDVIFMSLYYKISIASITVISVTFLFQIY